MIRDLGLAKAVRIPDIGTGLGNMAIMLALNGYKVLTGEPSTDDSQYARQDWRENAKKVDVDHLIEFKSFDAGNLPFGDNVFDAIFMMGSLHHIDEPNRGKVWKECNRTTERNAVICIFKPNQNRLESIRQMNPSHPHAAYPLEYVEELHLEETRKK